MRKKMVNKPRERSVNLVSLMCSKMDIHDSKNSFDFPLIPKSPLTWEDAIVIAVAVVNPTVTGTDIKVTKKPLTKHRNQVLSKTLNS